MKALKAITIGTSVLALIPLVSAADEGLISQGVEVLFGATTGGGIFTKLGLFIILFAFLSLGAKKVFPEEHSRMGTLVAALLALIGMKFMPEVWVAGLGTLIWVAALALLPYAIVTIFLKEDTKKKWIFVVIAYLVLLFAVFQMKGFPSFARSIGLRGEFWEDMSYKFGAIGRYWYVWVIAAVVVAFFIWLFTRGGKGDEQGGIKIGDVGGKVKGPGLWGRIKDRFRREPKVKINIPKGPGTPPGTPPGPKKPKGSRRWWKPWTWGRRKTPPGTPPPGTPPGT
ncbi:MAG: hypothetical protein QME12_04605, partial [Nanoarchaeota archaeon]|nr:hypothetical protein [Nanoarchaeota archaeon]